MAANEAVLKHGDPLMVDYTPGSAVLGGEVVVQGDIPMIPHRDIAANELGALAAYGGVYEVTGDAAIAVGKKVYWDNTANKVTETETGNTIFGYTIDSKFTADGDKGLVVHMPDVSDAVGTITDLNGVADALILDADADTTLSAPTDDQIDVEVGGSDVLVITATGATAAAGLGFKGQGSTIAPLVPAAAQQALSGAGAVTITEFYTAWTTTGADAGTLADGAQVGQLKKIQLVSDGGDGTLTPTNLSGGTTITFADAGDYALLMWDGTNWVAIELGNDADGATAPVLA